jgi:hypothetical protein
METKVISVDNIEKLQTKDWINQNKDVNLILDLTNVAVSDKDLEELFLFNQLNDKNGTTFVVVKENVDFDNFSQEWNIVPTIEEAKDLICLEEMMRDLE